MEKDLIQEILERVVRIETKIDGYNHLWEKVEKAYSMAKNNAEDIKEMKDNNKWLWRTIAGALILSALAALVSFR